MKKILLLALAFYSVQVAALAQVGINSFSATGRGGVMNTFVQDYQSIGVNPANLGRRTPVIVAFTIGEGGLGGNSQSFTRATLSSFLEMAQSGRYSLDGEQYTLKERRELAKAFANDNVLNAGADLNIFAVSVHLPKVGGFAFSSRQRALGHLSFNRNFSELVFLGRDAQLFKEYAPGQLVFVSELFEGTAAKGMWVKEWNASYGRRVFVVPGLEVYAGLGYRYLHGMALYQFTAEPGQINFHNALSPNLKQSYERYQQDPYFSFSQFNRSLLPAGRGHGLDIGLSAELEKFLKLSASVTDIGSISWTDNMHQAEDKGYRLPEYRQGQHEYSYDDASGFIKDMIDSSLVITPVNSVITRLPTQLRLGAGMKVGKDAEIGVDYVRALNDAPGNIYKDFLGLGVDVNVLPHVRLSTGVSTGAGDKVNLPVGIAVVTRLYEFGVSTRDIAGAFSEYNPGASLAMGFLRFKIGEPKPPCGGSYWDCVGLPKVKPY